MSAPAPSALAANIAAALDWWREAGVDATFLDTPRKWLGEHKGAAPSPAPAARKPEPAPPPPLPQVGGDRAGWPQDLAAFQQWWLTEPSLDEGGFAPRVAPAGAVEAELMVLVAMPGEADRERLLSGPSGALLDCFLAAAGLASAQVYRASVLPRHTPLADWQALAAEGMGAVLAHHVAVARPRRLMIFGQNILPLCGHDPAQGAQKLQSFNHEGGRVPALAVASLDRLLGNGQLRARLWKRWLEWTDGQTWDVAHE